MRVSRAVLTPPLLLCYAQCGVVHIAFVSLSTLLPFHLVAVGGNATQVGLLFSLATGVSLVLRPPVGGWIDRNRIGPRRVLLPGITVLAAASLALHVARDPASVFAVAAATGVANALLNTTNSVVTARAMSVAHRGETLSLYYLASSLGIAAAPPGALAVRAWGGMALAFAGVTGLALLLLVLALAVPRQLLTATTDPRPGLRVFSRHARGVYVALVITTLGHSCIYAFLPLYATSRGHATTVVWFFAAYSVSMVVCRALCGVLSDHLGRVRVALPAMILTATGYFLLAMPTSRPSLMTAAVLLGSGNAMVFPTLVALVLDRTPGAQQGLALGSVRSAWDLGVLIGSALIGFVTDRVSFAAGVMLAGTASLFGALILGLSSGMQPRAAVTSMAEESLR